MGTTSLGDPSLARLLPANRRASGGWDQKVALGHGQAEVEGRLEDSGLIVRVDAVGPIGRRPAQLDGDQRGMGATEDVQGNFGRGCGRREVVSIVRPAHAFRVVGGCRRLRWRVRPFEPVPRSGPRGEGSGGREVCT